MDGLKEGRPGFVDVEVRRGGKTNPARHRSGEVRDDVAEQVVCDDHVVALRVVDYVHGASVGVFVVDGYIRELRCDFFHDALPQVSRMDHDVGLVDVGEFLATLVGLFKCVADRAFDSVAGVDGDLIGDFVFCVGAQESTLSRVRPFGSFTHHDEVDVPRVFQGRAGAWEIAGGAQVDRVVEFEAQFDDDATFKDSGWHARVTDCAKENGVVGAQLFEFFVGEGFAGFQVAFGRGPELVKVELNGVAACFNCAFEDFQPFRDCFFSDSVAGNYCNLERSHRFHSSPCISLFSNTSHKLVDSRALVSYTAHMPTTIRNKRAAALPAKLSRSWLLVNALRPESFETAQTSESDSVIFDLEAAVPEVSKDQARDNVVNALSTDMAGWVRINSINTPLWEEDLDALNGLPGLKGVMLPNTEEPDQVTLTAMRAGAGIPVLALIETAIGIEAATRIAQAPGTFRLALGTNDFRKDTGVGDDPMALAYARSRLVVATRVGGLPGAIDGPSPASANSKALLHDCGWTLKMGMTGKLILNPQQAVTINDALAPSEDDRTWARKMLEEAEAAGDNAIADGSYLPRLSRAKKIAQLSDSYGLWKN